MRWLFLMVTVQAAIHVEQDDWAYLESNPIRTRQNVDQDTLDDVVRSEWENMVRLCPSLDQGASIRIFFDDTLEGKSTLAWATQTMFLNSDRVWYPALSNTRYSGNDFTIGINPSPPNGWFNGDCKYISYRYDLRSVVRHEILHGIGLGSSISYGTSWEVGHLNNGLCFPRVYDTLIRDENNNKIVDECRIGDISGKKIYLGGVELYHPEDYVAGSSVSHHNYPGHLLYYKSTPMKCMYLSKYETSMLATLGTVCSEDLRVGRSETLSSSLVCLLILLALCFHLR
jgi:hypothetical protein